MPSRGFVSLHHSATAAQGDLEAGASLQKYSREKKGILGKITIFQGLGF